MRTSIAFRSLGLLIVAALAACGGDDDDISAADAGSIDGGSIDGNAPRDLGGRDGGPTCEGVDDGTACTLAPSTAAVCVAGTCTASSCGDSVVDPRTEDCDDGNADPGDGCEPDTCAYTCASDTQCTDGNSCNGLETCAVAVHRCQLGTMLDVGADCTTAAGAPGQCNAAIACGPVGCGNGLPSPGEQCDDGNVVNGDGCENDCTFSCESHADCDDGSVCSGTETCDTTAHTCAAGTPLVCTPAACTTACGTTGVSACLPLTCALDVCRAPTESCNFCDDNANGIGDDIEAAVAPSTTSATTCALYLRSGDATGCTLVNVDPDTAGTLQLPGSVKVGYGAVTFRAELTMTDLNGDDQRPSTHVDLRIGYGTSCVGTRCRFYGYRARWIFSSSGETDAFELTEVPFSLAVSERLLASASAPVAFNGFDSDDIFVGASARRMELVYTPSLGASPGSLLFRDAQTGLTLLETSLPAATFAPGAPIWASMVAVTGAGPVGVTLAVGPATNLTAARTCP
jgi:cysteine-rich repeat protein